MEYRRSMGTTARLRQLHPDSVHNRLGKISTITSENLQGTYSAIPCKEENQTTIHLLTRGKLQQNRLPHLKNFSENIYKVPMNLKTIY